MYNFEKPPVFFGSNQIHLTVCIILVFY